MNLIEIFAIIIIHFVGDFVLQTDWQAKNKSKNNEALLQHIARYSACWFIVGVILKLVIPSFDYNIGIFVFVTFICHIITDYFTSRWVKKSFDKQDYHNGFVKIGFDQILHYIQLFTTYWILTK